MNVQVVTALWYSGRTLKSANATDLYMAQYSIIFKMLLPWVLLSTWYIIYGLMSSHTGRKNCPIMWGKEILLHKAGTPQSLNKITWHAIKGNLQVLTVENKIESIYKQFTCNIEFTHLQRQIFPQYLPWITVSEFTAEACFMSHILFIHSKKAAAKQEVGVSLSG